LASASRERQEQSLVVSSSDRLLAELQKKTEVASANQLDERREEKERKYQLPPVSCILIMHML